MGDVTRALVGLEDFEVTGAVETAAGVLEVSVRVARPDAACVRCGTFSSRVKEYRTCRVRDGLSYERPTVLVWTKRRFRCETPGCVRSFTESTRQVAPRRRVAARLCAAIALAAVDRSTAAVARSFRVGWATAWRAIAAVARDKLARRPVGPPRLLGVDETTFRRYRSYMTGLVDLDGPRLWDFIEGRSKKVLVDRLEALGEGVRSIEAVVIDPYAGYKAAVRDAAPRATRVADHFHIVGLANAALTDVRTRRQQEITGHRGRKGDPLWSVRHDLLRAREHLTDRAWGRLGAAFQADWCDELECAWTLKEMLRDLYTSADRATAEAALAPPRRRLRRRRDEPPRQDPPRLGTRTARLLRHRSHQRAHRRHQPDHQSRQTPRLRLHQRRQLPHPRPLPLRLTHSGRQTTAPPLPHQTRRARLRGYRFHHH